MSFVKPWSKRRGKRLNPRAFRGIIAENLMLFACTLVGMFSVALALDDSPWAVWHNVDRDFSDTIANRSDAPDILRFWTIAILGFANLAMGLAGLFFRLKEVGLTDERRSARSRSINGDSKKGSRASWNKDYPELPYSLTATESPGVYQRYRLASEGLPVYKILISSTALAVLWNGASLMLFAVVLNGFLNGAPRWIISFCLVPSGLIGLWSFSNFLKNLGRSAGLGSTIIEIDDYPIFPGTEYNLFVRQSGRMSLRRFRIQLVCEEETSYRQGTDLRVDRYSAFEQVIYSERNLTIDPRYPLERQVKFKLPSIAIHSFRSVHNSINWKLVVSGESRPWPSFCRNFPVVVFPPQELQIKHHQ